MTTKTKNTTPQTENLETVFWDIINEIKKEVRQETYGVSKGKGGSTLKNSNSLSVDAHDQFSINDIHYDIIADNVKLDIIRGGNDGNFISYVSHGTYLVKWFFKGVLVYESKSFGAFDEISSTKAVHGSLTCARTDVLFTMLQVSTKTEDELLQDRTQNANRQAPRPPAHAETYEKPY